MAREIVGQIANLSKHVKAKLDILAEMICPKNQIVSPEIAEMMAEITREINKEVAIYLDRFGRIEMLSVGSDATAPLPVISKKRKEWGLCGLRAVHTHPGGDPRLSEPDLSALSQLHLDMMCAIGVGEESLAFSVAVLATVEGKLSKSAQLYEYIRESDFYRVDVLGVIAQLERSLDNVYLHELAEEKERVVLVWVLPAKLSTREENERIMELCNLAKSADLEVVEQIIQHKDKPDGVFCLGRGKLAELAMAMQNHHADCVIFENTLSPAQENNLAQVLGKKVLDKNGLILDIFAARAQSREGQLQVEAAQLNYLLPRLSGQGVSMSRLGGGVGTRGPGETKLETDRRHIRKRLDNVRRELEQVEKQREVKRQKRKKNQLPQVALVGYTNAGKSSLLNCLTGADIYAEDRLFATLDTTVRSLEIDKHKILLSDTVGFIRDLPKELVEAFQATLEELKDADLLLHVVDGSNESYREQIQAVENILRRIQVADKPMIYVFNKIDLVEEAHFLVDGDSVHISAKTGQGIDELREMIFQHFFSEDKSLEIFLPLAEMGKMSRFYQIGNVEGVNYTENGVHFKIISGDLPYELEKYVQNTNNTQMERE